MKKIIILLILATCGVSYAQKTNIKTNKIKEKYKNLFYKNPKKYNNQEQIFKVDKIVFSTSYKGSKLKSIYQISIHGKVNNNDERVLHNAKSIDELKYYKSILKGKYKKILFIEYDYFVSNKKYHDTSITVEF
ncbi:hypothetical protein H3Z83_00720 [Tenacibaculum sp. S7007]|uniref:Uncharacterized protein n=1 Tax=Tenacibaculum pelagium TaxID=2759527 RepID=A0A839AKV9_9FLAO|nr:hypothetical protein [Tenacibaculum pelagium]MBA6155048.1 hypothetical protein [Tenacibaculum pelagium]